MELAGQFGWLEAHSHCLHWSMNLQPNTAPIHPYTELNTIKIIVKLLYLKNILDLLLLTRIIIIFTFYNFNWLLLFSIEYCKLINPFSLFNRLLLSHSWCTFIPRQNINEEIEHFAACRSTSDIPFLNGFSPIIVCMEPRAQCQFLDLKYKWKIYSENLIITKSSAAFANKTGASALIIFGRFD